MSNKHTKHGGLQMKIRATSTGKLHLSIGPTAANCSAGNKGMRFWYVVPANVARELPAERFCKKCFAGEPVKIIDFWVKQGELE